MLTSKQRAFLKGLASTADTILMVGKSGLSPELIKQANDALTARELVKGKTLETAPESPKETAEQIAQAVSAQVVQVIGSKFVLYRANPEKPVISLPRGEKKRS